MKYAVTSGPTSEPVTAEYIKTHTRIDGTAEDDLLNEIYIPAARQYLENYTETKFFTQTVKAYMDSFPDVIELRNGPFQSIDSVEYYDEDDTLQTYASANYRTDIIGDKARIEPVSSWPSTKDRINAVIVTFTAGYSSVDNIPAKVKGAICLIVAEMYNHREDRVKRLPTAAQDLIHGLKVY